MALPSWACDTVTIIRPTIVSERGKDRPDYDAPASTTIVGGCSVQPAGTSENLSGRQSAVARLTLFLPPEVQVGAHDLVEWHGARYHATGASQSWKSPTGAVSHSVVTLTQWQG
ncbi:Uncharacterised protein [Actinomyces bovis]|uniref:Head-to-tail stopper n=1 Tax=Actinomyces bovis TaxID=1658 RepID=A0ABY1VPX8_9ACTO|nr:hypothetical protein [Actinomyces bovis]SPT53797.1 Uncharacterised protein [Actinomyces bovis]VEG53154.1 Uncharacterised protein [Actinomyces israelii]